MKPPPAGAPTGGRLVVALVRGVRGLRGAVRVEVLTDRPTERFVEGGRLYRERDDQALTISEAAPDGPGWRLRFDEVGDRTAAEALQGAYLEADVSTGDAPEPGTHYWHDVVGQDVHDLAGRRAGTVRDVYRAGETEVFVIADGPFGEFDVPAARPFIRVLDPGGQGIVIDIGALGLEGDGTSDPTTG